MSTTLAERLMTVEAYVQRHPGISIASLNRFIARHRDAMLAAGAIDGRNSLHAGCLLLNIDAFAAFHEAQVASTTAALASRGWTLVAETDGSYSLKRWGLRWHKFADLVAVQDFEL